jgi:hypothetical protein
MNKLVTRFQRTASMMAILLSIPTNRLDGEIRQQVVMGTGGFFPLQMVTPSCGVGMSRPLNF